MRRKLASLITATVLLLTFAPAASAAVVTNCQDGGPAETPNYVYAGEPSDRDSDNIQAIRGDWSAQSTSDPYLATCTDSGNTDGISASSVWISISGSGPSEIMQIGVARCAGGCADLEGAGNDSNGNPIEGIPNDNEAYLFWTWGGRPLADGPVGSGPKGIKIAAWNESTAPRFAILRTCNQTDCTDDFYRAWYFVWSQDGTTIENTLAGHPTNNYPDRGWVQLDEWNVPWAVSEPTVGKVFCETWDRGDQCGWNEPASLEGLVQAVKVKEFDGDPLTVPPAWANDWVNPKFTTSACDTVTQSWIACQTYTSQGGQPDTRFGSVRLETVATR